MEQAEFKKEVDAIIGKMKETEYLFAWIYSEDGKTLASSAGIDHDRAWHIAKYLTEIFGLNLRKHPKHN